MKRFLTTIQNIFRIEDLKSKLWMTLICILVYRLGAHIVLPGIDPQALESLKSQAQGGLFGLLDMFAGGAFSQASIFAIGIMPYISASIVIQLLSMAMPSFQKLQKEGESGRKKLTQWTRLLTVGVCLLQAPGYLVNLQAQAPGAILENSFLFTVTSVIILTAGTLFVMWLGEKIQDRGIGNGTSLIIMVGIIARLPQAIGGEFTRTMTTGSGGILMFLVEIIFWLCVIAAVILLVQGTRKIPVQFAKTIVGNRQYGGVRQYIPLKVNTAGVMPIIFAQAIMFIPLTIAQFFPSESMQGFLATFTRSESFWYNFVFALLIIVFTYFYTAIAVNPNQMADDMKKNNGFIPGVKPGRKTAEFIDEVMSRITLPGALFLAIVAILPAIAQLIGINQNFAQFFGGTSMLIMVGVILDTLQQIESQLLMRKYDGLMKSGRIKGRTTMSAVPQ